MQIVAICRANVGKKVRFGEISRRYEYRVGVFILNLFDFCTIKKKASN